MEWTKGLGPPNVSAAALTPRGLCLETGPLGKSSRLNEVTKLGARPSRTRVLGEEGTPESSAQGGCSPGNRLSPESDHGTP